LEVKADERAAAGWKPDGPATAGCGACPLTSAFRVASFAAKQRSLKPRSTGQHRGDSPISWKLNRTSAPGLFRKQIVPLCGMGSMTSGFRHFMPAWQSSHALVL